MQHQMCLFFTWGVGEGLPCTPHGDNRCTWRINLRGSLGKESSSWLMALVDVSLKQVRGPSIWHKPCPWPLALVNIYGELLLWRWQLGWDLSSWLFSGDSPLMPLLLHRNALWSQKQASPLLSSGYFLFCLLLLEIIPWLWPVAWCCFAVVFARKERAVPPVSCCANVQPRASLSSVCW